MTLVQCYELTQRAIEDGKVRYISREAKLIADRIYVEQRARESASRFQKNLQMTTPGKAR